METRPLAYAALATALCSGLAAAQHDQNWPQFRGPQASGVAEGYPTATEWNVDEGENIAWRTEIPGLAHSSPVIWGDKIFLTTAVREGEAELKVGLYGSIDPVENEGVHQMQVVCLDRDSGEIQWVRTAWEGEPAIMRHPKGSHAASTPATDGERVLAFFASEGLYAYDMEGELLWKKDFGVLDSGFYMVKDAQWGFASSPVLHEGMAYVQIDVQGQSFVAALDAATGEEQWRTDRDEVPTWGTPTVYTEGGQRLLLVNGYQHIGAYDLDSGEEVWSLEGGGDIPVPTPVVSEGVVYITNAHGRMAPILAIETAAEGELVMDTEMCDYLLWMKRNGGCYMQTPIVYGGLIYCCRDNGTVWCLDAETGDEIYRERIGTGATGFTASGVVADGKLYFPSEEGEVQVIRAGTNFEILAVNDLGETCMATPAAADGVLYFRTRGHLIAVRAEE